MSDTLMECAAVVVQNPIFRALFVVFVGLVDLVIGRRYGSRDGSPPTVVVSDVPESEAVRAPLSPVHEHSVGTRCVRRGVFLFALVALVLVPFLAGCSRGEGYRVDPAREAAEGEAAGIQDDATIVASADVAPDGEAAELARIGTQERVKSAAAEAAARVDELVIKSRARLAARADFAESVKRWTGFVLFALGLVGVAALIGSFLPAGRAIGLDGRDAATALAGLAGVSLARYILLAWGVVVADGAVLACIVLAVVGGVAVAIPLGYAVFRRYVWSAYTRLAAKPDEASAATAVWAVAVGATGDNERDRTSRRAALHSHMLANQAAATRPEGKP